MTEAINAELANHNVDLVLLLGYMRKLGPAMLGSFRNRILNIHPTCCRSMAGRVGAACDFGEISSGTYRLRVDYPGKAFCAPEVRCVAEECSVNSTLKPNPKNMVMVE